MCTAAMTRQMAELHSQNAGLRPSGLDQAEPGEAANEVDPGDTAKHRANKGKIRADTRRRERVQRPNGENRGDASRDEGRYPTTRSGQLSHAFAGTKEAIPRSAEEDAADVQRRRGSTRDAGRDKKIIQGNPTLR